MPRNTVLTLPFSFYSCIKWEYLDLRLYKFKTSNFNDESNINLLSLI